MSGALGKNIFQEMKFKKKCANAGCHMGGMFT